MKIGPMPQTLSRLIVTVISASCFHVSTAIAADVDILAASLFTAALVKLKPEFERTSGHRLNARHSQTAGVKREVEAGGNFDVVLTATRDVDEWLKQGRIDAASRAGIGGVGLGIGVRSGSAKPDISSPDAFKAALLNARSVAHAAESASAVFFKSLLERLGITEAMGPKLRPVGGGAVTKLLANGDAELGIATVPTILAAPGVDFVGPLPKTLQTYVSFSAGVSATAKEPRAAEALITFLKSATGVAALQATGVEPVDGR